MPLRPEPAVAFPSLHRRGVDGKSSSDTRIIGTFRPIDSYVRKGAPSSDDGRPTIWGANPSTGSGFLDLCNLIGYPPNRGEGRQTGRPAESCTTFRKRNLPIHLSSGSLYNFSLPESRHLPTYPENSYIHLGDVHARALTLGLQLEQGRSSCQPLVVPVAYLFGGEMDR